MSEKCVFRKISSRLSPGSSLIVKLKVVTTIPGKVYVKYANPLAGKFVSASSKEDSRKHLVTIGRLRAETSYTYRVYLVDSSGKVYRSKQLNFTTGKLPEKLAASLAQVGSRKVFLGCRSHRLMHRWRVGTRQFFPRVCGCGPGWSDRVVLCFPSCSLTRSRNASGR